MRYLLCGGGTGGHVFPALAIANEIKQREPQAKILFIGTRGKIEEKLVPQYQYPIRFIMAIAFPYQFRLLPVCRYAIVFGFGLFKSLYIIARFKPSILVATGGYVSAAPVVAARLLRFFHIIPTKIFIHEQNVIPGRLNRLLATVAHAVGYSFTKSKIYLPKRNALLTGYPVRKMSHYSEEQIVQIKIKHKIAPKKKVVFVFGGSLGARSINEGLIEALPLFKQKSEIVIIHSLGTMKTAEYDAVRDSRQKISQLEPRLLENYQVYDFIYNIDEIYSIADLVVCRAGAGTLMEIAQLGLPALIIPKGNLPGDHQVKNARALQEIGGAKILYEEYVWEGGQFKERVNAQMFFQKVSNILEDPAGCERMAEACHALATDQALNNICTVLQHLAADVPIQVTSGNTEKIRALESRDIIGGRNNYQLLLYLKKRHNIRNDTEIEFDRDGHPLEFNQEEKEYLLYKINSLIYSAKWTDRNLAIKMGGLVQFPESVPLLLNILKDSRRAFRWQRMLGGDYLQNGFIRRNCMVALYRIGLFDEAVCEVLIQALEDPYYEVRAMACKALYGFWAHQKVERQPPRDLREKLSIILENEKKFIVICWAIRLYGFLVKEVEQCLILDQFFLHPNWIVREALIEAYRHILVHQVFPDHYIIRQKFNNLLVTSIGFEPEFKLRTKLGQFQKMLH